MTLRGGVTTGRVVSLIGCFKPVSDNNDGFSHFLLLSSPPEDDPLPVGGARIVSQCHIGTVYMRAS